MLFTVKKIVVLGCVFVLQGLSAFGQTNGVSSVSHSVPYPEWQGQWATTPIKVASDSATLPKHALAPSAEIQPTPSAAFLRINREGLLLPRMSNGHLSALDAIFGPENNQVGQTGIRNPAIVIFPPGR